MPTKTYDLASTVGKVRALIGDPVVSGEAHFTDEELAVFLAIEGDDLRLAGATALDAWAASFAVTAQSVTIGRYSESTGGIAQAMTVRAKALREAARTTPAFGVAAVAWDGLLGFAGWDIVVNRALQGGLPR